MGALDTIASVTISTTGSGISRQGFSTIACILNDGVLSAPTVETYTSSSAVATAKGTNSPGHRMAVAAFSQSPRPKKIKLIRTGLAIAQVVQCTVASATAGVVTTLKVYRKNGTAASYSYTQGGGDTTTSIATALVALINAGEAGSLASNSASPTITLNNITDGDVYYYDLVANLSTYLDNTADPGLSAKLTAARALDDDWYGMVLDVQSSACVQAAAGWAESNGKMLAYDTADDRELSSSVLAAALKAAAYTHTFGSYHAIQREYQAVAWMAARMTDLESGQANWSYATLAGVTVDSLNDTQKTYLTSQLVSYYVTIAGRNVMSGNSATSPGGAKVASGEWIDIIHGNDWIKVRTQEDVVGLILDSKKLPFSQAGLNAIGTAIKERLEQAASPKVGFLLPGSVVVLVPDISTVSAADRQARIANGFEATAKYASAINYAGITLSLGY